MKNFSKSLVLSLLVFGIISGGYYLGGYRLSPLAAAKIHFDVGQDAQSFGQVNFDWGTVFLLSTPKGPRTVMVIKNGFLWRAPASFYFPEKDSSKVRTVGWMSFNQDYQQQATVFAVKSTDPNVAFISAGPQGYKVTKPIKPGEVVIFSWPRYVQVLEATPIAYSKNMQRLYEYRYPKGTTSFKSEDLKWYALPVDEGIRVINLDLVERPTREELTATSEKIVIGVVKRKLQSYFIPDLQLGVPPSGEDVTDFEIEVNKYIKDAAGSFAKTIVVTQSGSAYTRIRNFPLLKEGEKYLIFLPHITKGILKGKLYIKPYAVLKVQGDYLVQIFGEHQGEKYLKEDYINKITNLVVTAKER